MTETTGSSAENAPEVSQPEASADSTERHAGTETTRAAALRESLGLISFALLLYYLVLTFVARPYLIPSESMEPTLHGCHGCVGDRILVEKVSYACVPFTHRRRCLGSPQPGDVVVFRGPPSWNVGYKSIRSTNTALRWVQNTLSVVGFVPPDENDLVKRVIAVGGQTVQCRNDTGVTVDGKHLDEPYLDPSVLMVDPAVYPCLGPEFGPVTVPAGRLWVMGDNRTHSADSRAHCDTTGAQTDPLHRVLCNGPDAAAGTVPVVNVIGKTRLIAWPPSRWGLVRAINPQQGP